MKNNDIPEALKSSLHFVVAYLPTLLKAGRCSPQILLPFPVGSKQNNKSAIKQGNKNLKRSK